MLNTTAATRNWCIRWIADNDNDGDDEDEEVLAGYLTVQLAADLTNTDPAVIARAVYKRRHRVRQMNLEC